MSQEICKRCAEKFEKQVYNQVVCEKCRKILKSSVYPELPTSSVAGISEAMITLDLLTRGYSVFKAIASNPVCSLIAIKNEEIRKIEVRTGTYLPSGLVSFPKNKIGKADWFAVFTPIDKKTHHIEINSGE